MQTITPKFVHAHVGSGLPQSAHRGLRDFINDRVDDKGEPRDETPAGRENLGFLGCAEVGGVRRVCQERVCCVVVVVVVVVVVLVVSTFHSPPPL